MLFFIILYFYDHAHQFNEKYTLNVIHNYIVVTQIQKMQ